ncbi:MAG: hypothetical protein ACRDZ6_12700 [Acidimicrobiales bacterium]
MLDVAPDRPRTLFFGAATITVAAGGLRRGFAAEQAPSWTGTYPALPWGLFGRLLGTGQFLVVPP